MKYFKLYDKLFIAINDQNIWIANTENIAGKSQLQMLDVGKNPEFEEALNVEGIVIKDRIFEMKIPRVMTGQEHMNVAFYLGNLENKGRKI